MESVSKLLHQLTEHFISLIEKQSEWKKLDERKLFAEILRRRIVIGEQIQALALEIQENYKLTGIPASQDEVHIRIERIFSTLTRSDFFESAVNSEGGSNSNIGYDDLIRNVHNSLFVCALEAHIPSQPSEEPAHIFLPPKIPSFAVTSNEENSYEHLFNADIDSSVTYIKQGPSVSLLLDYPMAFQSKLEKLNSIPNLPSAQFELMHLEFENKIIQSGGMWEKLFRESQLGIVTNNNEADIVEKADSKRESFDGSDISGTGSTSLSIFEDNVENMICDAEKPSASWESCIKHSVRDNKYTSDLQDSEAPSVIAYNPEWNLYQDLFNFTGLVEHSVMILQVLDMLIGLPSSIFPFSKERHGQFRKC